MSFFSEHRCIPLCPHCLYLCPWLTENRKTRAELSIPLLQYVQLFASEFHLDLMNSLLNKSNVQCWSSAVSSEEEVRIKYIFSLFFPYISYSFNREDRPPLEIPVVLLDLKYPHTAVSTLHQQGRYSKITAHLLHRRRRKGPPQFRLLADSSQSRNYGGGKKQRE